MPAAYPILIDVSAKRVVIIGGGNVALRKASALIDSGAQHVRVVSPVILEAFPLLVERVLETYKPEHLEAAALVFAATDSPAVNSAVVRDARHRNIWVSRADVDAEEPGDFSTGAKLQQGSATLGVWTENPALSTMVRDKLRAAWDPRWSQMADAMRELRPIILASELSADKRRDLFRELASEAALDVLAAHGQPALWAFLAQRFPQVTPPGATLGKAPRPLKRSS